MFSMFLSQFSSFKLGLSVACLSLACLSVAGLSVAGLSVAGLSVACRSVAGPSVASLSVACRIAAMAWLREPFNLEALRSRVDGNDQAQQNHIQSACNICIIELLASMST